MQEKETKALLSNIVNILEADIEGYKSWGKVTIKAAAIRLDEGNMMYRLVENDKIIQTNFNSNLDSDIAYTFATIFSKFKKANAILITNQSNGSQLKSNVPPILDDQAQLLGPTLKHVKLKGDIRKDTKAIVKSLKGRYAATTSNGDIVCIGKNMDETYVAAQLVEKTAKAFLQAKHIGGAKSINIIEAWAMHKFYMLKYSKESEKNK